MRVSVVLPDFLPLGGEERESARFLRWVANEPAFEKLEVFLPPAVLADASAVRDAAESTLASENRGRGRLSFYVLHDLPEVWSDGVPRILRSLTPSLMARDRYLRDSFSAGPVALSVDAQTLPAHEAWSALQAVLEAEPAPYDSIQCATQALSDALRAAIKELGAESLPFRLDVVPQSVDCERFRPPSPAERGEARASFRIPAEATVAICHSPVGPFGCGDLYPLVQAFFESSGPDDWLVIGGEPTSDTAYARLKGWVNDAGLANRVRLLGCCRPDQIVRRLWAADFFVIPCDTAEAKMDVAPIEAMATGLPVVASDWAGLGETVRDGENGYLVPTCWVPGSSRLGAFSPFWPQNSDSLLLSQCVVVDQESLAEDLGKLFRDPQLRARLGEGARRTALARRQDNNVALFKEQLREATLEPPEARDSRKRHAWQLALPSSYNSILSGQGTRPLGPDEILELTDVGREILDGSRTVPIYQEVALLATPKLVNELLERLRQGPASLSALVNSGGFEDAQYASAVLMKRGAIRLALGS